MSDRDDQKVERDDRDRTGRRRTLLVAGVAAGIGLLILGAFGGAFLTERRHASRNAREGAPTPTPDTTAASPATGHGTHGVATRSGAAPSDEPAEVTLSTEATSRAGIKVATVSATRATTRLRVPGTVASNAYRDTKVHALVAGIMRQVSGELGAGVRRGAPLAVIFSNELGDAQMKYLSARAMLQAEDQKFERTRKLTELGAASRQELDDATAARDARATEVAAARQRLILLGFEAAQIDRLTAAGQIVSEVVVPSPADGIVIARSINPGQVVGVGQELFTVADLSTVWIIADVYEKDFGAVALGTPATVSVPGQPPMQGRVAYIDPRVESATRTAKVRIEVPNRHGALRLGMYVDVAFAKAGDAPRAVIPRAAVQSVGSRSVVYVATDDEGRFIERPVRLGEAVGDTIEVIEGVRAGERIVVDGSFYLRAEAARARQGG
jgi:cobalt-zinc-cadmium efflux system membrane fusion protein